MQPYIKETSISKVSDLLLVKLELLDIGKKQGWEDRKCYACKMVAESTEHIISCSDVYELVGGHDIKWNTDLMNNHIHLMGIFFLLKKYIRIRSNN